MADDVAAEHGEHLRHGRIHFSRSRIEEPDARNFWTDALSSGCILSALTRKFSRARKVCTPYSPIGFPRRRLYS